MNETFTKTISMLFGAALLTLAAGCGSPERASREQWTGPIRGTTIQYQDWMMRLGAKEWQRELEAMRRAGIDTIVIQWLRDGTSSFFPRHRWSHDPTEAILSYADDHGMRVFVGLAHADLWIKKLRDPRYLERAAAESFGVADEAWRRYGEHRSFAGWYLSQEPRDANYNPGQLVELRDFFRQLGDSCRSLSGGKPVSVAPALMGFVRPAAFAAAYATMLKGSGVDIVMLQDGMGAREWGSGIDTTAVPYFKVMNAVCDSVGADLWSVIEIFEKGESPSGRVPAPVERIEKQIAAESPYVTSFVMFDFFHYMSPYRGEKQKKLYKDYLRAFVKPTGPRSAQAAAPARS
jgi:hypothetical protein